MRQRAGVASRNIDSRLPSSSIQCSRLPLPLAHDLYRILQGNWVASFPHKNPWHSLRWFVKTPRLIHPSSPASGRPIFAVLAVFPYQMPAVKWHTPCLPCPVHHPRRLPCKQKPPSSRRPSPCSAAPAPRRRTVPAPRISATSPVRAINPRSSRSISSTRRQSKNAMACRAMPRTFARQRPMPRKKSPMRR
ncbi:hypothetical protein SAMN06265795_103301 [Noviherbaspirillum humi]|uniref:Uncharacterized protein n=1 Tax=Noviherbaspirillum humi TaxID=1688639 RepID=A0A239FDA0_9BURK|nr:hypothetical protein SAMN06265795_103301 [Noviherbaspirillum humi]